MFFRWLSCPRKMSIIAASAGSILGIGAITLLVSMHRMPLLTASAGASAFLLYATPHSPLAQPRNCIGGHLISATVGVIIFMLFGNPWWAQPLAVSLAILLMIWTDMGHPPGAATALHAVSTGQDLSFVLNPVLPMTIILVLTAIWVHGVLPGHQKYPA